MPSTVLTAIVGIQDSISATVDNLQQRQGQLTDISNAIKDLTLALTELQDAMQIAAAEGVNGFNQLKKISIELVSVVLNVAKAINSFHGTTDERFADTLSFALHEIVNLYTAPFLPDGDTTDSSDDDEENWTSSIEPFLTTARAMMKLCAPFKMRAPLQTREPSRTAPAWKQATKVPTRPTHLWRRSNARPSTDAVLSSATVFFKRPEGVRPVSPATFIERRTILLFAW